MASEPNERVASPLLSVAETVAYLRIGQTTLYERMNQFEVVKLGKRVFITKASLDAYIAANTRKPSEPPKRGRRKSLQRIHKEAAAA